jgi:hypothetical protein
MPDDSLFENGKLYVIHSPTRVTLSAEARTMARMHGMSDVKMVKHLLHQDQLAQQGLIQTNPGHD